MAHCNTQRLWYGVSNPVHFRQFRPAEPVAFRVFSVVQYKPLLRGTKPQQQNSDNLGKMQPMTTANGPPPPLAISTSEAARLLGLSRYTVEKWVHRGRLRSILLGRRRLIETAELTRVIEAAKNVSETRAHSRMNTL